ncbi:MAG: hypothetical protein ACD_38C00169G0011 [uncultured bacterium]|uniref:Uncharacterized protein n=1 Tax=Candidatus Daviesbacteria bacterium GW2011_GWC2_40_12 TaxID=1618431 RepID=A0A0G0T477_9BACT|nr:MAG: hypothetical protein ACD_38C00169G0011 [uncultured bacterium]KKR16131.1 MAG: hypothetical protein UT45_C0008G0006 [Candidatus Daviesbacteria bacterium GW2011_GWA2_39_33]KKR25246.1 MAG: hypothetical protein UT54_C0005G0006 [Candidatus Daviesbacteria bacterium GW2011_GWB1_39_5]KKR41910.1 MAG: hypothetical protein UT77_C0005G0025 [Candidatus Daviesbacteria bacterium GW2011_GWC2_40_12]
MSKGISVAYPAIYLVGFCCIELRKLSKHFCFNGILSGLIQVVANRFVGQHILDLMHKHQLLDLEV